MLSMKLIEKNNKNEKQEKNIMNFSNNTMADLVQLSSKQSHSLKGNLIDRIREMNKNNALNNNCSNC